MYIGDEFNHRVRKVTVSTGIITTYAGNGGTTYSGNNGEATAASLSYPLGVALDSAGTHLLLCVYSFLLFFSCLGNLYIGDYGNNRIRKVTVSSTYLPR